MSFHNNQIFENNQEVKSIFLPHSLICIFLYFFTKADKWTKTFIMLPIACDPSLQTLCSAPPKPQNIQKAQLCLCETDPKDVLLKTTTEWYVMLWTHCPMCSILTSLCFFALLSPSCSTFFQILLQAYWLFKAAWAVFSSKADSISCTSTLRRQTATSAEAGMALCAWEAAAAHGVTYKPSSVAIVTVGPA